MNKNSFRFLGFALLLIGTLFFLNPESGITGAAAFGQAGGSELSALFGIILFLASAVFFIAAEATAELIAPVHEAEHEKKKPKTLEEKIAVKHTSMLKKKEHSREDAYYIIDGNNGDSYSLNEIKEASSDRELRSALRSEFLSDLLRLYSDSDPREKWKYRQFIEAMSPNSSKEHLDKSLHRFEEVYHKLKGRIKNEKGFMDPKRIDKAKESDFGKGVYVRLENERDTLWPEQDKVGFLPFDKMKVNPARGPLISVIPIETLIRHGYFLDDSGHLNPKWSTQKRKDYLKDTFGIDVDVSNRNLIFFRLENDAYVEPYGKYENIVVKEKVPLVKVIKKK